MSGPMAATAQPATEDDADADAEEKSTVRTSSFWLLYAVSFVEGADMQLLPSTFRALEKDLGLSPKDLAVLGMCQALAQCATAPVWGVLVDKGGSSKWILVGGSAAWALLTFLLACVTDFKGMVVLRMLNGVALATLTPVSQAVIANLTAPAERGAYFGYCGMAMMLGNVACAVFAASISNIMLLGFQGWRVAFTIVAIVSVALSAQLALYMVDVRKQRWKRPDLLTELGEFFAFFKIPSFVVIVIQGCFGSVPWSALAFTLMFFQYIGMPDFEAAVLSAIVMLSIAMGNVVGGHVGDRLTAWSRFHGRPLAAQISVSTGVVFILLLFLAVPRRFSSFWLYAFLLCAFGLSSSWCGVGVNRPILTEVVPDSSQGRVIAWLTALEGSMAACLGAPLVGYLAEEVFGYLPQTRHVRDIPKEIRQNNANALASGMLWMSVIPWLVCFTVFGFLHCTYRKDVENVWHQQPGEASKLAA